MLLAELTCAARQHVVDAWRRQTDATPAWQPPMRGTWLVWRVSAAGVTSPGAVGRDPHGHLDEMDDVIFMVQDLESHLGGVVDDESAGIVVDLLGRKRPFLVTGDEGQVA